MRQLGIGASIEKRRDPGPAAVGHRDPSVGAETQVSGPVQVILNPASAGGATRRLRGEVERELAARSVDFGLVETEGRGHAVELARSAAEAGVRAVVAVGGDGTVHEVANGLLTSRAEANPKPALAVIPGGSGNDFVKMLGSGRKRPGAYDVVANGRLRRFDAGWVCWGGEDGHAAEGEFFVNAIGTGIDVEVVRRIERYPRLPGLVGYLLGLVGALASYRPIPLKLRIDGNELETRVMIMSVGNGPCQGGGFYICPAASPEDGRFDTCVVKELGYLEIARVLPRVLRGTHGVDPHVALGVARRIEIETTGSDPLFFQVDGELREPGVRRFLVELREGVLPVLSGNAGR